jgi:TolB-like protein/tetratricopeptide (TPR) repeat protein
LIFLATAPSAVHDRTNEELCRARYKVRYLFEDHILDIERRELRRGSSLLSVEPQVFDLLAFLIKNRDRVVSRDDLLASVWGGRIVSESTLASRINAARRLIGDNGEKQRLIRTIIGKGLRFIGEVQQQADAEPAAAPPLSIVVLPFANLSNDPDLEYLVDGITDDLTTDLSRISGSFVIARNTAFTYKGHSVDVKQLGCELGVRYVLEGSVRWAGDLARINVQLTDAESGAHLWADRFDTDRAGLPASQDEIIGRIARTLNIKLIEVASCRIEQETAHKPAPNDLLIRGLATFYGSGSETTLQQALRLFEQALELDPASIPARVAVAHALCVNTAWGWSNSVQEDKARAEGLLLPAIERDANNLRARMALGLLRRLQNRLEESRVEWEAAIALQPYNAHAFLELGLTLIYLGQPEAAIPQIQKATRLGPYDSATPAAFSALAHGHLLLGDIEPSIEFARKARARKPAVFIPHMLLAAALALHDELDEAAAALAEGIRVRPQFNSLARLRAYTTWGNSLYRTLREKTLDLGLHRAGMPDE